MSGPKAFFSTFMYSACKAVQARGETWEGWLQAEFRKLGASAYAGFRSAHAYGDVEDFHLSVQAGTYITLARCAAAGQFLYGDGAACDLWVMADDDVLVTSDVWRRMAAVARASKAMVALPYLNRDGHSMTYRRAWGPTMTIAGEPCWRVDRIGMGAVILHREFVARLARNALAFEHGGLSCPAIFLEGVQEGEWVGEDYWMCAMADRLGLPIYVLLDAMCRHMGEPSKLDLDGHVCLQSEAAYARLEEGRDRRMPTLRRMPIPPAVKSGD
jgi:hypothetical protein